MPNKTNGNDSNKALTASTTTNKGGTTRRRFIQTAGAVGLAASVGPFIIPRPARAAKKTLKIIQWNHFVPGYDKWFDNTYIKEWGEKNDTEVIVDHVGIPALSSRAAAEVSKSSITARFTRKSSANTANPSTLPSEAPITRKPRNITASPTVSCPTRSTIVKIYGMISA